MEKKLKFLSDIINIPKAETFIEELFKDFNLNDELYGNVWISILEAVNNAINHGNKNNPTKFVEICAACQNNKLIVEIKDEGIGFDFRNLPDPTSPENKEEISGRGIFLIKNLSDMVNFENNGSKIIIEFNL